MELKINSHDKLGMHRAALAFAEERMAALRRFFDQLDARKDDETDRMRTLRASLMRSQIASVKAQLTALEALLSMDSEGSK